jgi:hypothetical protein
MVAVKVIHPELARDSEFVRRFRAEVEAARRVSGMYTAPVVAAGVDLARDHHGARQASVDAPNCLRRRDRPGVAPRQALRFHRPGGGGTRREDRQRGGVLHPAEHGRVCLHPGGRQRPGLHRQTRTTTSTPSARNQEVGRQLRRPPRRAGRDARRAGLPASRLDQRVDRCQPGVTLVALAWQLTAPPGASAEPSPPRARSRPPRSATASAPAPPRPPAYRPAPRSP